MSFAQRLQRIWYSRAQPPWPLRVLAALLGAAVQARTALYRKGWLATEHLECPVVVVGNLSVGGSGKTPLVVWLAEQLRAAGRRPGVILRGYGGRAADSGAALRVEVDSDPALVGDEAVLLRARTGAPVAVCRDRVRAARLLLDGDVDVLISDDGLQHLRLPRCFELAVVDAERGFGNGHLLPAGPLREPVSRLRSVDALVLNGSAAVRTLLPPEAPREQFRMQLSGDWLWPVERAGKSASDGAGMSAPHGARIRLSAFAGRRVHAIAGIGNPQRFFTQLRAERLLLIEHPLDDHHRFRPEQLQFGDGLPVLMTEKDAVKCRSFEGTDRWYLPVAADFSEADAGALRSIVLRALKSRLREQGLRVNGLWEK